MDMLDTFKKHSVWILQCRVNAVAVAHSLLSKDPHLFFIAEHMSHFELLIKIRRHHRGAENIFD